MKLFTSKTNSVLFKSLILVILGLVLNTNLIAQTCSLAVSTPTLSVMTQPLLCPLLTADLSNLVTSTAPSGMVLEWHLVSTNPSPANLVAMSVSATGTFYAYYYDVDNNCYSALRVKYKLVSEKVQIAI